MRFYTSCEDAARRSLAEHVEQVTYECRRYGVPQWRQSALFFVHAATHEECTAMPRVARALEREIVLLFIYSLSDVSLLEAIGTFQDISIVDIDSAEAAFLDTPDEPQAKKAKTSKGECCMFMLIPCGATTMHFAHTITTSFSVHMCRTCPAEFVHSKKNSDHSDRFHAIDILYTCPKWGITFLPDMCCKRISVKQNAVVCSTTQRSNCFKVFIDNVFCYKCHIRLADNTEKAEHVCERYECSRCVTLYKANVHCRHEAKCYAATRGQHTRRLLEDARVNAVLSHHQPLSAWSLQLERVFGDDADAHTRASSLHVQFTSHFASADGSNSGYHAYAWRVRASDETTRIARTWQEKLESIGYVGNGSLSRHTTHGLTARREQETRGSVSVPTFTHVMIASQHARLFADER